MVLFSQAAFSQLDSVHINSGNPVFPFPQFYPYQNPTEKLENLATHNAVGVTHAEMEQTIRDAYRIMMNRAKKTGTKLGGIDYVKFASNPDCSEGSGYAMLGAAAMADKVTFDGLWLWIHDNALHNAVSYSTGQPTDKSTYIYGALPGWKNATDDNSATDGDVDMAIALYIAYCQWGEFMGINDSKGKPISYKHDCIAFLKGLTDTFSFTPQSDKPLLTGDIGLDGYVKGGNTWGEQTSWAANPAVTGFGKPPYQTSATKQHIDYNAPAYFHEFADFLSKEDSAAYAWNIFQFRRAEASSDWLMGQFLPNPSMIPIAGWVDVSPTNVATISRFQEGEDFRLPWRTVLNPLWHGNPSSTWDPATHLVKNQTPNSYEQDIGKRFAKFLWDTRQSPWNQPCILGADKLFSYWGPAVTYSGYTLTGGQDGNTTGFFLNWIPGTGSSSVVISQDFNLMAEIYRYLEIEWDVETPGDGYLTSVPFYFHEIFRLTGLLTLSGNYHPPSMFKPGANMKVYMAINKTFGFDKDSVTYTIDYRNYGSLDAQNVAITDTLHKDFVFLSATGGGVYNSAANTVTWNVGTVPGFKTATGIAPTKGQMKLIVKVANATQKQYRNRATVSCANGTGWTSNEYPNDISSVMERNYLDIAKRALLIKQTASAPIIKAGDLVQFTIDFENSSEAGWINGGRPGVHFSYSQSAGSGSATMNTMRFRLFHDANEAYLDYNNYRISYFLFDEENTCVQKTGTCPTGWQITNTITEPTALKSSIKLLQENIMPGSDTLGKWNQRLVIQFADPSNSATVPNLVTIDHHLSQYRGMRQRIHKGGIDPLRLVWYINSSSWTAVNWTEAWSWDAKANDPKGDAGVYFPVTNDWTDPEKPDLPVNNWNPKSCEVAAHSVKNILVEEWDGYTWRRVAGNGPMPGREVNNVVIRDTIPTGFTFKEFIGSSPLGVAPKITGNIVSWSIPKMQIKEKGSISFTAVAASSCPLKSKKVINRSWISADKESPFSDSALVTLICDSNYIEIPPTKSTIAFKGPNFETISDTARIDTTSFHLVVTDKDQDQNSALRDTVAAWITNPAGSDSLLVKLVETGAATGTFQTAIPIAAVSGASGAGKIHMNPGDAVWATYVDPLDSTDVSTAYLITIASFPMPIRGWLFDANGDGAADSALILYNKAIDSVPDSIRFNFPDAAGPKTVTKAQGGVRILGTALAVSFAPPFPANVTAFTNTLQGNASAFLTEQGALRRIVFPLIDSIGPVITAAQAVERSGPTSVDTLFVTFSEAIQAASLKGASLILVKSAGPVVITIDSAHQLVSNRFAVALASGSPQPLPGDSLRINWSGPIRDLPGNAAHPLNPKVEITVKIVAPSIVNGWYVDRDARGADGLVDTAFIRFNKKVTLSGLSFLLDWGSGLTSAGISGDALSFAGSDSVVAIALQPSFQYAKYVRTMGDMLATVSFASFPGESDTKPVKDSAAPVIDYATYIPDASLSETCDTLEVALSEPVTMVPGLKPFVFSGRTGISYEYDISPIAPKDNKTRFCIKFTSDRVPRSGDSICIFANGSVKDIPGTFQNNPVNRKVALRIMPAPSSIAIKVLKSPFTPHTSLDSLGIRGGTGTAIVIVSKKKNATLPDLASATIKIFDGLGNCVHEDVLSTSNVTKDGNGYYFVWDGYNTKRRAVSSGVYVALVNATENGGAPISKKIRIGVKR
jgi:uncharacterized repeat protein (TIGR01451 family)